MTDSEEKIRRRAYELWDKAGAAGMLKNIGSELKERLGEVRHRLIRGQLSPGRHRQTYGKCFCGVVEVVATGEPLTMGYCHCTSCRQWSGSPVNAFTIWFRSRLHHKGRRKCRELLKTKKTVRKWCQACGGHLLTERPLWLVTELPAAILPDLPFRPALHLHYAETVLRIRDGFPKQKDIRTELGGSGELLSE